MSDPVKTPSRLVPRKGVSSKLLIIASIYHLLYRKAHHSCPLIVVTVRYIRCRNHPSERMRDASVVIEWQAEEACSEFGRKPLSNRMVNLGANFMIKWNKLKR